MHYISIFKISYFHMLPILAEYLSYDNLTVVRENIHSK